MIHAKAAVLGSVLVIAVAAMPGRAYAQSQLIGDKDCFGFGGYPCSSLAEINLPEDRRSAAEAAAVNGAQQTDFYSSNFVPLPYQFDVVFPLTSPITSGTFSVGMGGFQSDQFGQFLVALNGVNQPDFFNFQDGPYAAVERAFTMSSAQLALINAGDELRLTINRDGSNDGTAFDYFQFDYNSSTTVPEPASMILFGSGLVGLAAIRRRRNQSDA